MKPDGSGYVYLGYVGGAADDVAASVAVASDGSAFVVGATGSSEGTFPVHGDGLDETFNGGSAPGDAFVAEVRPDGTGLAFAGYIGGTDDDVGTGVALAPDGGVIVVGTTLSTESSFPVTGGPFLASRGASEAFVVKVTIGPPPPPAPTITSVTKVGKFLVVMGSNFEPKAVILVNGVVKKTKADPASPSTTLKSKKAGKTIKPGDTVKVRNPDGTESNEVVFAG